MVKYKGAKKSSLYLASQSPRRKKILREMGIAFRVVKSSYREKFKKISPEKLVMEHAVGKAKGAKISSRNGIALGSDTLVYCQGKILGKPKNISAALKMLSLLSGRAHEVYSGVALHDFESGKTVKGYEKTKVFMRKISKTEMLKYIQKVHSLDKAGAYAIQMKPKIVTKIQGSYSNVMGLPKKLVKQLVQKIEGESK